MAARACSDGLIFPVFFAATRQALAVAFTLLFLFSFFEKAWAQDGAAEKLYREYTNYKQEILSVEKRLPDYSDSLYLNGQLAAPGQNGFIGKSRKLGTLSADGYKERDESETRELCADSLPTFSDYQNAELAKYSAHIAELLKSGHLFFLPSGTRVIVLDAYKATGINALAAEQVLVISGNSAGRKCFVQSAKKIDPLWIDSLTSAQRETVCKATQSWSISWELKEPGVNPGDLRDDGKIPRSEFQLASHMLSIFKNCSTVAIPASPLTSSAIQGGKLKSASTTIADDSKLDSSTDAKMLQAINYLKQNQCSRAIEQFNKLIDANRKNAAAYIGRGSAYQAQGENELAIQDFDQGIKLNPASSYAYAVRGLFYERLKQYDRAIQDLDQALKLDPSNAELQSMRTSTYNERQPTGNIIPNGAYAPSHANNKHSANETQLEGSLIEMVQAYIEAPSESLTAQKLLRRLPKTSTEEILAVTDQLVPSNEGAYNMLWCEAMRRGVNPIDRISVSSLAKYVLSEQIGTSSYTFFAVEFAKRVPKISNSDLSQLSQFLAKLSSQPNLAPGKSRMQFQISQEMERRGLSTH
jgi:tetratricopeptide (TPR) repeat protein